MATKITKEVIEKFSSGVNNLSLLNEYGILYSDMECLTQTDIGIFYRKLSRENYTTASTYYANPERNNNLSHYYTDDPKFSEWRLYLNIRALMWRLNFRVKLEVAHVNITNIATQPVHHIDGTTPTAIYYANPKWEDNWGGETWLLDENHEVIDAIKYRPGRVIIFNGNRPHISRTPTHYSKGINRLALAIRFNFIDSNGNAVLQMPDKKYELIR